MAAPQTVENAQSVDAFILFNDRERDQVSKIVSELATFGISTYFWQRDIPLGQPWQDFERIQLEDARTIVLFLGRNGWGPNHRRLAQEARELQKPILPVLIDEVSSEAFDELGGFFRDKRYLDLPKGDSLQTLADEIRRYRPDVLSEVTGGDSPATSTLQTESSAWLNRFAQEHEIGTMTTIAREVLERAANINRPPNPSAEISSTRLLVAMNDVGRNIGTKGNSDPSGDGYGLIALARVLSSAEYARSYTEIAQRYISRATARTGFGPIERVAVTNNVATILAAGSQISLSRRSTLSADALVAAFLRQPGTNAEERLTQGGLDWANLRQSLFDQVSGLDRPRVEQWRVALNIESSQFAFPPSTDATIAFAPLGNDNPDAETLDDKLGVADEAKAFARVAAARQVVPPLAFGIFGDWGSGKSFFMRMIKEHVDKLENRTAKESKTGLFHDNIVQIRFNAWHYVDSNLWASLVDYIFLELDRWILKKLQPSDENTLFDKLATARDLTANSAERLVRRRRDQKIAGQRLADAERQLAAAQGQPHSTGRLFWSVVRTSFENTISTDDLKKAVNTLGLGQLESNTEALKKELDALKEQDARARVIARGIRQRLVSAPSLVIILLAIVLVPPVLVGLRTAIIGAAGDSPTLAIFFSNINAAVLAVAGVMASAASLFALVTKKVRGAVDKLEGYQLALDKAISEQVKEPADLVKTAQTELNKLTADVAEAQAVMATTSDRLAEAAREYASGTGRGRLLRFVRDRATNGEYAKHLGLVATVRRDFTDLSAMMSSIDKTVQDESRRQADAYKARVAALVKTAKAENLLTADDIDALEASATAPTQANGPIFERIILYIDDLDRCPPDKVVDVLQAVHLLLTFPLFVVVVAVDARWVSSALEAHYDKLLGPDTKPAGATATARDYLEKIFQVPYWVRPMTPEGSRNLLLSLATLPPETPKSAPEGIDQLAAEGWPNAQEKTTESDPSSPGSDRSAESEDRPRTPEDETDTDACTRGEHNKEEDTSSDPTEHGADADPISGNVVARALELTEGELAFMQKVAPFVGNTPRRALRFLNVYRVVKASLVAEDLQKLEQEGGYRGLMMQLGVTTGSPALRAPWSDFLTGVDKTASLKSLEAKLTSQDWYKDAPDRLRFHGALKAFWSSWNFPAPDSPQHDDGEHEETAGIAFADGIECLRQYDGLAKRYSFGP